MTGAPKSFATTLTRSLAETLTDGQLTDPQTGEPVPSNQYAETCFATAALRVAAATDDDALRTAGANALDAYLSVPETERGHGEFNAFALTRMLRDAKSGRYELPVDRHRVTDAISFNSGLSTGQGNNWLLLRVLCEVELADLGVHRPSRWLPVWLAAAHTWEVGDGTFADYPRLPVVPPETPLTYHAKQTYLAARLANYQASWKHLALGGARALYAACLPDGELLYFGRSENTLFGYACVLGAVSELYTAGHSAPWLDELAGRTVDYLDTRFNPGRPHALPQYGGSGVAVDDYVHDAVYSAYAAMVLLDCPIMNCSDVQPADGTLDAAGLVTQGNNRSAVALATRGQHKTTRGRPDPRYAGMIPHAYTYENRPVLPGMPPEAWDRGNLPFLPTVRLDGDAYTPVTWSVTSTANPMVGTGHLHSLPEATGKWAEADTERPVVTVVKSLARRSLLSLARDRLRKRPVQVSATVERTVHYLRSLGVLVVQTRVNPGDGTVIPSSVLVSKEFKNAVTLDVDAPVSTVTERVTGHRCSGVWIRSEDAHKGPVRTAIIYDPGDKLEVRETAFENGVKTTLHAGEKTYVRSLHQSRS